MKFNLPRESLGDRLLKGLGKRRAVYCPMGYDQVGPLAFYGAKKEWFFAALFSRKNRVLKPGTVYLDDLLAAIEREKRRVMGGVNRQIRRADEASRLVVKEHEQGRAEWIANEDSEFGR